MMPATSTATKSSSYPLILLATYLLAWLALAIDPNYRDDWMLENVLPVVALPLLIVGYRRYRFSNSTCTLTWLFMLLHAVGAHYTYAEVPYDSWARTLTGHTVNELFGWQRNHFDRLVHFFYGALLFPLCWDLLAPRIRSGLAISYLLVLTFIMSHAGIYEVIEWAAAALFGGDLGVAYLGTQGDEWDAQRDMALAFGGSLLAAALHRSLTSTVALRRKIA